jgi:hypothetical protein
MGFIVPEPPLRVGEQIRWRRPLSYSFDRDFVGGRLYATSSDLMFVPGKLSPRRYKEWGPLRIALEDIATFGVQDRTGTPYSHGLRRRLRVALRNGDVSPVHRRSPGASRPRARRGGPYHLTGETCRR